MLALLLGGCGGDTAIRGELTYDLRPAAQRTLRVWPAAADVPRYRYVGELVGEPNFVDAGNASKSPALEALHWLAGVSEQHRPLLMQRPHQGVVSDSGRVHVVDAGRNVVFVFDPNAPAEEKSARGAGRLSLWEFAYARTRFQGPVAAALVWGGDVAVSDAALGFVARINALGVPLARIGAGQLRRPTGLAFDPERGLLFVADTGAHDIKVFDEAGRLVNTIGAPGQGPGEFNAPSHLAFAAGQLHVSDTLNSRIQVFDAAGRYQREFGERGLLVGNLARPKGVAVGDAGVVYVVESYFGHLLVYSERHEFLMSIDGSGLADGAFLLPAGVWTDKRGRVFVADMFKGRVVVYQFLGHDGG